MQCTVIEYARDVLGWADANSTEFDENTTHPVIDLMEEQRGITQKGGTMRLGAYPCAVKEGTTLFNAYGAKLISERHRHRYEFNNDYRKDFEQQGIVFSGTAPDNHLVEAMELPGHAFFVGVQFHPEFKSRPNKAHPLFREFLKAASSGE